MRSLAVKYRPQTFEDVVSQDNVKSVLMNQLETGEFKNAYLFCGGAGTGKTTTARIVAKDMNEGKGTPIEIDGASNNGVDNIREIIDKCKSKSLDCKYKVFIIDEVHMLSIGAFNALLKTLEEPPAGAIFILCTTDPQKIPGTILSRVQRFDFKRIPSDMIIARHKYIIDCENAEIVRDHSGSQDAEHDIEWAIHEGIPVIEYEEDALEYIAKLADGGMRDSITMLDKVLGYSNQVTLDNVIHTLGATDYNVFFDLLYSIVDCKPVDALTITTTAHREGKDLKLFIRNFTNFMLDVVKYKLTNDIGLTYLPTIYEVDLKSSSEIAADVLLNILEYMNRLCQEIKWESNPKPLIEAELILLCQE